MDSNTSKKTWSCFHLPNNFYVAFTELLILNISIVLLFFFVWLVVWPNPTLNNIFNDGFGPFHGFKCNSNTTKTDDESAEFFGRVIFIGFQCTGFCMYFASLIYCVFDHYFEQHGTLADHKIFYPGRSKSKISWILYRKSIALATRNAFWGFLIFLPNIFIPMMEMSGTCNQLLFENDSNTQFMTNILILIVRWLMAVITGDFMFYFAHRMCHSVPWIYQRIHKIHHQFVDTYGISATAAHPLEHLFVNVLPLIGAPIVSGLPLLPLLFFVCMATVNTTVVHAGYRDSHDFHHHFHDCEFGNGSKGIADKLFGTQLKNVHPKVWRKMMEIRD